MSKTKLPIIAIVGRANVGKSSLFNTILDRREAIVAREAGTTRDSIMAKATYNGQDFWIVDTAGIKEAEDDFEFTIQEQIQQAADSADIIWVVIEANLQITEEDRRVAKMALKSKKPVFLVVNKYDKALRAEESDFNRLGIKQIMLVSSTQNRGIDELLDELTDAIPKANLTEDDDRIRVALLGRPNVGKSALFNSLAKKQQAIVADRAGTTRDINRAVVRYEGREIEILDTAGIRRSGKIERGIEKFSVVRSLAAIEQSDVCLMLMDANELNVALDQKIAGMVKESGKGLVLVVSKWDSLEKDAYTRDAIAPQIAHNFDFVPWAPLILTSSVTGQNVTKLFDLVLDIVKNRDTKIKTTILNRWLRETTDKHPPAGLKNRSPKLNYMVQEDDNRTNFKVYGAHTKFLHWSYKRYMDRKIRETFGFSGTPLKFWFFEKHETHKHGTRPSKPTDEQ
ncbi:MAG: ribosome biogenesis GTPase Der [Candidatus Saccharimonadales bacterium]